MKIALLLVAALILAGSVSAQVRKCTGADGKVTYSDLICSGNTVRETGVSTNSNTLDASATRQEIQQAHRSEAVEQALQRGAKTCRFAYFAIGDTKGQALAAAAKKECLDNIAAKVLGQATSLEAYTFWKDHSGQESKSRDNAMSRANNTANARSIANSNRDAIGAVGRQIDNRTYKCKKSYLEEALECK